MENPSRNNMLSIFPGDQDTRENWWHEMEYWSHLLVPRLSRDITFGNCSPICNDAGDSCLEVHSAVILKIAFYFTRQDLMVEANKNGDLAAIMVALSALGATDAVLFSVVAESTRLEAQMETRAAEVKAAEQKASELQKKADERRTAYQREEKKINEEREKLTLRRKALTTLSSYKLQQAASKEITLAEEGLGTQEEGIISILDEAERLSTEAKAAGELASKLKGSWDAWASEARGQLETLYRRAEEYRAERIPKVALIPGNILIHYDRVRSKFPSDPVAVVTNHSCTGCFMSIGPQQELQIRRGIALVRCPGCGRILRLDEPAPVPAGPV